MTASRPARIISRTLVLLGVLTAVLLYLGGWLIDEVLELTPVSTLLSSPDDDRVYVATRLARGIPEARAGAEEVLLALFGSSATREAFLSSDAELSSAMSERLGRRMTVVNFATSSQSLRESLVLVDNMPDLHPCVHIVGISPLRFQHGRTAPMRIPLRSVALEKFDAQIGATTSVLERFRAYYHWHWLSTWFPARISRGRHEISYMPRRYMSKRPLSIAALQSEWHRLEQKNAAILDNLTLNAQLLEFIIQTTYSRGCTPVLMEQVHHPVLVHLQKSVEARYRLSLSKLIAKYRVTYLNYHHELEFQSEDFADHLHLGIDGKKKFESWFVGKTAEILRSAANRDKLTSFEKRRAVRAAKAG